MTSNPVPPLDTRAVARGYIFIIIAVLFWSGSASLAKHLLNTRFDTLIITQARASFSFLLLGLYFLLRNREVFRIDRRDLPKFILIGILGIAVTNFAYYFTVQEATVSAAIVIQYTAPVLVMMYAVAVSREETLNGMKVLALLLSLTGCFLAVSGGSIDAIQLRGWSLVSGITSSLCYAFMLLMSKHLLRRYSVWTMLTYAFGFATIFWLLVNPPWVVAQGEYTGEDWGILWMFAVVSILIPHSLFGSGLKLLEASTVGIVTTLEPVLAIVIAYLALNETLNGVQAFGAVAVAGAILLLQVASRRKIPPRSPGHAG